MDLSSEEKQVSKEVNSFLESKGKKPLSTIINTIFPATLNHGQGATELFADYDEITADIRSHPDNKKWGNYFMRMASRTDARGKEIRPLQKIIERLQRQKSVQSPKHAWYELSLVDPYLEIPIYDNLTDPSMMMGGPCLTHMSFKLKNNGQLGLTALYRSHYYIERTLGNLYGLALLQDFVAKEAGLQSAELVCHSTMAQIDTGKSKPEVTALLDRCHRLISESAL